MAIRKPAKIFGGQGVNHEHAMARRPAANQLLTGLYIEKEKI
jgi:hypothetical protein